MCKQGEAVTDVLGMYSEGVNDDINKFVCLSAAWDGASPEDDEEEDDSKVVFYEKFMQPSSKVPRKLIKCLFEYARCLLFVWEPNLAMTVADIILKLERDAWGVQSSKVRYILTHSRWSDP